MHIAITGASSGIGEALAHELSKTGAKLTLVARRADLLEKLSSSLADCHCESKDLSDEAQATSWVAAAEAKHGPIDVLINNAGMENTGQIDKIDLSRAEQLMRLNLHTPIKLMHLLLPAMLARRSGSLINVASMASLAPMPMQAWYSASKGGLSNFSEALRSELLGSGVNVLTVYPGPVTTPLAESAYQALGGRKGIVGMLPEGNTQTLARRIRRAMEHRSARVIYPRFYYFARWFPGTTRLFADIFGPKPYKRP